jgi:CheY-like chemotaxis protein
MELFMPETVALQPYFSGPQEGSSGGSHQSNATSQHPSQATGKPKIIVADDEPLVAFTLTEILEDAGYEVISVRDGMAAVEKARTIRPDLVLTDVMMPKLNGIEAAKQIQELFPQVRIVLFSGQAATGDLLKQAREQGYDFEIVTKPIQPDALLTLIGRPRD